MKALSNSNICYFTHSKVVDLVFIMAQIFDKNSQNTDLNNIYSEAFIEELRANNRFLTEIISALQYRGSEMLEFLLLKDDFNNLEAYKKLVYSFNDVDFFHHFFGQYPDAELIKAALKEDRHFSRFYEEYSYVSSNYLALKSLFLNKELFLEQYFSCLEKLETVEFANEYVNIIAKVYDEYDKINAGLAEEEPLEFSQKLMGKTFHNRGPYNRYTFIPSYFINRRAMRFFMEQQFLIYSPKRRQTTDGEILKILKVISDDKRFQIIEQLSKGKSIMGKELAERVDLSKATISHHIEQLKEIGFITEERVKNAKYYGINANAINGFIAYLTDKLKKE